MVVVEEEVVDVLEVVEVEEMLEVDEVEVVEEVDVGGGEPGDCPAGPEGTVGSEETTDSTGEAKAPPTWRSAELRAAQAMPEVRTAATIQVEINTDRRTTSSSHRPRGRRIRGT